MTDTVSSKPKLQLGNGIGSNGILSPTAPTKLLINHGKPNFTIQRSPKTGEYRKFAWGSNTPAVSSEEENEKSPIVESSKFIGVLSKAKEKTNTNTQYELENESAKVVLRRAQTAGPPKKSDDDDNVPEFIRRQRAIQERLSKENVLDFENRRSGYFTHVVISPTTTNRTSFVETMASPAVNPSLEMPAPQPQIKEEIEPEAQKPLEKVEATPREDISSAVNDEEVANAIEEVNKALAGEDIEEPLTNEHVVQEAQENGTDHILQESEQHVSVTVSEENHVDTKPIENGHIAEESSLAKEKEVVEEVQSSAIEEIKQQTQIIDENNNDGEGITISHTNGMKGPHIPNPDPSGALGVNYEPKTVVSFSKDLGAEENKYPDTIKVVNGEQAPIDSDLQVLSKVKFDINTEENDIQVTPVVKTE